MQTPVIGSDGLSRRPAPRPSAAAMERGAADFRLRLSAALVNQIGHPLIVCDEQQGVHFANEPAVALVAQGGPLVLQSGRLACPGPASRALAQALREAIALRRRKLLSFGSSEAPLLAMVLPLPPDTDAQPLVLMWLSPVGGCTAHGLDLFAAAHGITWAERRVLAGLLSGLSPQEIARRHGVGLSTVRSQVSALRIKLDVSTVEALIVRAAAVPPVGTALGLHGASPWHEAAPADAVEDCLAS